MSIHAKKFKPALFWSYFQQFAYQFVRFVFSIFLARLLAPGDFGMVGMLAVFFVFSEKLIYSGFATALIQRKDVTIADTSTVFYYNLVASALIYGLLFVSAPAIAGFYGVPELELLLQVSALKLVLNSFGSVHRTMCTKYMEFKLVTVVTLVSTIAGGLAGITAAMNGWGVWSLVTQTLVARTLDSTGLVLFYRWRPALMFSIDSLRRLFPYGFKTTLNSLLESVFRNLHEVFIGKYYSPALVGFYTKAKTLQEVPFNNITGPLTRATFPLFAGLQGDPERLERQYMRTWEFLGFFLYPVMVGAAACSENLVLVLLTEKWAPCVPYLKLFCVIGIFLSLRTHPSTLLRALDRVGLVIRLQLTGRVFSLVAILLTIRHGVEALLLGEIAAVGIASGLFMLSVKKLIPVGLLRQLAAHAKYVVAALVMGIGMVAIDAMTTFPSLWTLLLQIAGGMLIYLLLGSILRMRPFLGLVKYGLTVLRG